MFTIAAGIKNTDSGTTKKISCGLCYDKRKRSLGGAISKKICEGTNLLLNLPFETTILFRVYLTFMKSEFSARLYQFRLNLVCFDCVLSIPLNPINETFETMHSTF